MDTNSPVTQPRAVERLVAGPADVGRRGRQAHARADAAAAAPARSVPDARRVRHRQPASDYIGGFPDHPHRGFETVTYMIAGRMRHRDSAGHEGLLQNGGVQWMTAGRGVIHSELPEQEDGRMEGFQLWLNLPAEGQDARAVVSRHPDARRFPSSRRAEGVKVRVIAGAQPRRRRRDAARGHRAAVPRPRASSRARASRSRCRPRTTRSSTSTAASCTSATPPVPAQRMAILAQRRRTRRRRAAGRRAGARAADRRQAAERADRAVRPVRDEHATRRSSRRCEDFRAGRLA